MDDIPHELLTQLAGVKDGETVYLKGGKPTTVDTQRLARPDVAAMAESYFESGDALVGDRLPNTVRLTEKPHHRIMIWLAAQGMSPRKIAEKMDVPYNSVVQILRQPWARAKLTQYLREAGLDEVQAFLKNEVSPSLEVLRAVRDEPTSSSRDKIAAANAILDRALGKPTQKIESDSTTRNVPADLQRLDAELAAVRAQLADKGVASNS
jgi:hypothetical protein